MAARFSARPASSLSMMQRCRPVLTMANPARSRAFKARGQLGDDVLAVAFLLDHADDGAKLALGAGEALEDGVEVVGGDVHGWSFTLERGRAPAAPATVIIVRGVGRGSRVVGRRGGRAPLGGGDGGA